MEYDGEGFLEKNRDSLPTGANELMQASQNPLIELIFKGIVIYISICICTYIANTCSMCIKKHTHAISIHPQ